MEEMERSWVAEMYAAYPSALLSWHDGLEILTT